MLHAPATESRADVFVGVLDASQSDLCWQVFDLDRESWSTIANDGAFDPQRTR